VEEQEVDHRILTLACAVGEVVGAGWVRTGAVRALPQVGDQLAVALSARGHRAGPAAGAGPGIEEAYCELAARRILSGRGLGREVVRRRHGPSYVDGDPGVRLEPSSGAEPPATWTGSGKAPSWGRGP